MKTLIKDHLGDIKNPTLVSLLEEYENSSDTEKDYNQLRILCNIYNELNEMKDETNKNWVKNLIEIHESESPNPKFFNALFRYLTTEYGTDEERDPDNAQAVIDMYHASKNELERSIVFEAGNPNGEIHSNLKSLYGFEDQ